MKDELIFIGYRKFVSKKGTECYVLDFLTLPKKLQNGEGIYCADVSVFTESDKYLAFINKNALLSKVPVSVEVIGNRAKYSI